MSMTTTEWFHSLSLFAGEAVRITEQRGPQGEARAYLGWSM